MAKFPTKDLLVDRLLAIPLGMGIPLRDFLILYTRWLSARGICIAWPLPIQQAPIWRRSASLLPEALLETWQRRVSQDILCLARRRLLSIKRLQHDDNCADVICAGLVRKPQVICLHNKRDRSFLRILKLRHLSQECGCEWMGMYKLGQCDLDLPHHSDWHSRRWGVWKFCKIDSHEERTMSTTL